MCPDFDSVFEEMLVVVPLMLRSSFDLLKGLRIKRFHSASIKDATKYLLYLIKVVK